MGLSSKKLAAAREASGRDPALIAVAVGLTVPSYYDLEACEEDINTTVSLEQIVKLCAELNVPVTSLCEGPHESRPDKLDFGSIAASLRKYLNDHHLTQAAYEEQVGWSMEGFLDQPSVAWQWNVDCLKDVCAPLGINWVDALPE